MDDWLWFGGEISLDFVNTLRDRFGPGRETLHGPEELARWIASTGQWSAVTPTEEEFAQALRLRAAISRLLENPSTLDLTDLEIINGAVSGGGGTAGALSPKLEWADAGVAVVRSEPSAATVLGLIAGNAIEVFERGEPSRIKTCAHERCGIAFVDTSRANSRRWCSMKRCGNRAKVAKYTHRQSMSQGSAQSTNHLTDGSSESSITAAG
ncbi:MULTISPECIES: CGNR zinc finger domain-containing protein [unclassified Brevibacterium]|uniref:CGNR zinc finger domain-containing protein n=1 Tax=unclassified Brevibacterium TaxID=2614124 RepID=UPI00148574A9|nr:MULTISPECIES: CGNR zinc finger domain-containing protein [unclassified Brevibacterium]MCM1013606.1 CGNR zinc finger domain-containing protein [Brevibacterium sp. XM4083]